MRCVNLQGTPYLSFSVKTEKRIEADVDYFFRI